jgi:hypothetical protein
VNDTNLIEDLRLLAPPDRRWALVIALALAALLALAAWWRRRRQVRPFAPVITPAPGVPPWDTALAELERLTALLRPERARDYAIASTTVLRWYLEQRHGLQAPRLATEEFLAAAGRSEALPSNHRESLGRFLQLCDLLKFGRYAASGGELGELHAAAVAFVLASRPPAAALPPALSSS